MIVVLGFATCFIAVLALLHATMLVMTVVLHIGRVPKLFSTLVLALLFPFARALARMILIFAQMATCMPCSFMTFLSFAACFAWSVADMVRKA